MMIGTEKKPYFHQIMSQVAQQRAAGKIVYPPQEDILMPFVLRLLIMNVVILGQDPYHGPNQAHGLSFQYDRACQRLLR